MGGWVAVNIYATKRATSFEAALFLVAQLEVDAWLRQGLADVQPRFEPHFRV